MTASTVIVTYEIKPEKLDEHVGLIEDVFEYLNEIAPDGVHYAAFRSSNAYQFTHVGHYESEEARSAASENDTFAKFTAEIADRCVVAPNAVEQQIVGNFGAW